jgi:RimJ/RimL family protein N-acetyltransferase
MEPASLPEFTTPRLVLRPYALTDAAVVQRLAGVPEVALTTKSIPHPYEDGMAEEWISTHQSSWEKRESLTLAITHEPDGVVGTVSLHLNFVHQRGELGYWVGFPHWSRGYATEASAALLDYGFVELGLHRIQARHMTRNRASGRVMQKLGMTFEGVHRHHMFVRGQHEDIAMYAMLRSDR